jgi:hypothetical protein
MRGGSCPEGGVDGGGGGALAPRFGTTIGGGINSADGLFITSAAGIFTGGCDGGLLGVLGGDFSCKGTSSRKLDAALAATRATLAGGDADFALKGGGAFIGGSIANSRSSGIGGVAGRCGGMMGGSVELHELSFMLPTRSAALFAAAFRCA